MLFDSRSKVYNTDGGGGGEFKKKKKLKKRNKNFAEIS